jgi:hypothetical protein
VGDPTFLRKGIAGQADDGARNTKSKETCDGVFNHDEPKELCVCGETVKDAYTLYHAKEKIDKAAK